MQVYNARINSLYTEIDKLKQEIKALKASDEVVWTDKGYNYLAIGNSITKHGICDYWWTETGMASSSAEKDYVHLVEFYLTKSMCREVRTCAYNFCLWETQSNDRAELLVMLDKYLGTELNLVTIQLGENVCDTTTYEKDFRELIDYVRDRAPRAQIIVIDDFWDSEKCVIKQSVVNKMKVDFVSLPEIRKKSEYQCGLGTIVYDVDGNQHIVEHSGVACHPGDRGMQYIADEIIKAIRIR